MKLSDLKKYLKETTVNGVTEFTWYKLSSFDIALMFFTPMVIIYLIGESLHRQSIIGLEIIPLNLWVRLSLLLICLVSILYLVFNRKCRLTINKQEIWYKSRSIFGKNYHLKTTDILEISEKLQKSYHESDTGYYPEIYTLKIILNNGSNIRIGSFNHEDCERLKSKLKPL